MPVDIELIRKRGGTPEALKKKFTRANIKAGSKIKDLIELSSARINEGIQGNLRDARLLWAIDEALDVSKRQITPTLVRGLLSAERSSEGALNAVKEWKLDGMLTPFYENGCAKKCSDGTPVMALDLPTFYNIFVPVVLAYTNRMWAKLYMERDLNPLYKYEPTVYTLKNKLKCDLITSRVQRMAVDTGLREVERQSILQTLQYSICLSFPMEDWYKEEQMFLEDGKGEGKKRVVKEGIRYVLPHARRMFYDFTHRPSTLNSDTGCEWAGYWDIMRYRELAREKAYWNQDSIDATYGAYGWIGSPSWKIYHELFPCKMTFPDCSGTRRTDSDRIDRAINRDQFYGSNHKDNSVVIVPFFQKIIPSEWDLYDYDYPVWHRMLFAAEDTVLTVEPLAYSPVAASLYDFDENRAFNTSLSLKLLPWQDHLWNYLTQYLLSVKQNLTKAVFWNQDLIKQEDINQLENLGEKLFRSLKFIPFSKREMAWQQQTPNDAFFQLNPPIQNTQEIGSAIQLMISIMERMLGFSAQEVGAAASHEQSAQEVGIIAGNQSVSLQFTGSFIDIARSARKRQLYDAMMAYSDDQIFASIADLDEISRASLKEMGFEVEEEGTNDVHAGVKGSIKALVIEGFASDREGQGRIMDSKIAAVMIQTFQVMFSSPEIVQSIGVKQLIEMFNQMLYYAGAPKDYKLRFQEKIVDPAQQVEAQKKQLEQLQQVIQQISLKTTQEVVSQEMATMGKTIRTEVVVPLQEGQQKLGEAIVALVKRQQASDQKDGVQDQVLAGIIQTLRAAAQAPDTAAPIPIQPVE